MQIMNIFGMNNGEGQEKESRKRGKKKVPTGGRFLGNIANAVLIFLLLIAAYTLASNFVKKEETIALSELAAKIVAGEITEISVEGEKIIAMLTDGSEKISRKESDTAFSETLSRYGVSQEQLGKVKMDVRGESGFGFFALNILPFLLPVIFIIVLFWMISRQVKGAGMQALSFGQSKARIIDPGDKNQRVTFEDVAGVKEAKEELLEIVDFLKSPKKFLDIGARIPKGVLLMGAPGTGKCVTGETQILTQKGLMRIDEIPKYFSVNNDNTVDGLRIVTLNHKTLEFNEAGASHWYDLGNQETIRMATDSCISLEGTHEHPVIVIDEDSGHFVFRRLDEIKENDFIALGHNTQTFGSYTKIPSPDAAYLMGVLTGDGCLTIRNRIILSAADSEIIDRAQDIARNVLGATFSKTNSRPYDYEIRNAEAKARLISWGLSETYAEGKRIPEWIRIAPKEYVVAYLRGLFDTDGSAESRGNINITSASGTLIEDMQTMLLNIGIVARSYNRKKKYNGKNQFYLSIYGDFVEQFRREIGFTVKRKSVALEKVCARQRNTNINSIPHQGAAIQTVWKETVAATNVHLDRAFYNQTLYKNTKRYITEERFPSINGMNIFLDGTMKLAPSVCRLPEVAYLRRLGSGQFFFTRVKGTSAGKARVYDLTVPHTHNFLANGIINHNTLLARAVAGEAKVPFFIISGSEFVEMFVGVGASVTGDTPVLVKTKDGARLIPIAEVVDPFYQDDESGVVKSAEGLETLGYQTKKTAFRGAHSKEKSFFGGSAWSNVKSVYRHKAESIYRISYLGGEICATGDHSVFVRDGNMIRAKEARELKVGDVLVNLPFKVRGAFIAGFGTTHAVRAHTFREEDMPKYLDLYSEDAAIAKEAYAYAMMYAGHMSQYAIAERIGVSQATVGNWQNGIHKPQFLSTPTVLQSPERIAVTPDLMRLLGYYTAEGRTTEYYTQFVFGLHETALHEDCTRLINTTFGVTAHVEPILETNSMRITIHSAPIARFFERHSGTGSHKKHAPEFLWLAPKRFFTAYLEGYSKGDGYTTGEGKLSMTSVSRQLIRELAWLCGMHGIQAGVRETRAPAGRTISLRGKPLPETISWNLIIGKTSHPFTAPVRSPFQFKKPIIMSITEEPYDGYVYDLCGCEGEAFFGGEKPTLLHNSRVRDLFKMAKKAAPAIIFVDEIDAVGRVRGGGMGGGNDEREQTLNQILVEMDGFEPNEKVIIIAATNRPDVLDPALLRPGRFDRRVVLDLPDRDDREEILKIHARKKPLGQDVNIRTIAERTPGFSGADLYSLMNEGAILAAREERKEVTQYDLIRSIEKVMLGPERRSHLLSKKEKEITAYHEAGHALVASVLPFADPVHKISIVSRGHAGGYTLKLPIEERRMQSRKEFFDDIAMSLGGYVAEEMIFGDITTGPSSDLQVATALARDMVTKYGMSEATGPLALESLGGKVIFGRGVGEREYSEEMSAKVDAEVARIMREGKKRAEEAITMHRKVLDAIAKRLMETETIEREEFDALLVAHGITPKKGEEEKAVEEVEKGVV